MKRPSPSEGTTQPDFDGCLTLRLLGEPALIRRGPSGEETRVLAVGKPLALLTYLAVSPQREATRELLADLLWGGGSVADPAHSLRNALVTLKNCIDADIIDASATRCRLARAIHSDLDDLSEALHKGQLREVAALYTGEFFAGFAAPGCAQFEHWCESVRHRVRTDAANATDVLVRQLLDAGHSREAAVFARRLSDIEPHAQRGRRALIESLIASGDDLGALTEAAVFEQWLHEEELDPEPASTALIVLAKKGRADGRRTSGETRAPLAPDLIGRESEFAELMAAWERARSGESAFVAITAGAGVGKSRLLSDAASRLRAERARTVVVGALPSERDLPYALLSALVSALAPLVDAASITPAAARVLASLDPSLAERYAVAPDASATDQLLRRALALRELLIAVTERKTTAVLIDDVHWADDASVDAILAALSRLTGSRLLVATAARPGGRHPLPMERALALSLHPLSLRQVEQLVESVRPLPRTAWASDACRGLHSVSHGIPLFAILALRDAEDAGLLVAGDTEWTCADPAALIRHFTGSNALSQRLQDLDPAMHRMLGLLALAGRAIPLALLAASGGGVSDSATNEALADLERRALVTRVGDRVSVSHDLVTEAMIAALHREERDALTRQLAHAMLATHDAPWVERAVRLLANVASPEEVADAAAPALRALPAPAGISAAHVVSNWMGTTAAQRAMAAAVVRHLPFSLRMRHLRRSLAAGALVLLAGGVAAMWYFIRPAPAPDAVLRVVLAGAAGQHRVVEAPLFASDWNAAMPIAVRPARESADTAPIYQTRTGALLSFAVHARLAERVFADSGASEVLLMNANGSSQRLTNSSGDDAPLGWSPDGRSVVIASSRWSPERQHRLGILDVATRHVRAIGTSRGREGPASWSPDGRRIAFVRRFLDDTPLALCLIDANGEHETCNQSPSGSLELLGWLDARHLLIFGHDGVWSAGLWSVNPDSAWRGMKILSDVRTAELSPNGRWLAWQADSRLAGPVFVAPVSDVRRPRRLAVATDEQIAEGLGWTTEGIARPFADSMTFAPGSDTIFVGVPHRVRSQIRASNGDWTAGDGLRWSVSDSSIAGVDDEGTLLARRTGTFSVRASLGGWRTVTMHVAAVPRRSRELLREDWARGVQQWRLFGDPQPRVVEDAALGRALSNEGDGSYFSGAYVPRRFSGRGGLAVDALIRTPLTELQWQSLLLDLHVVEDSAPLARWDHRSGYFPSLSSRVNHPQCGAQYPASEGAAGRREFLFIGDAVRGGGPLEPATLGRGVPWRLRIQILPDGRCAVAVNGHPLAISNAAVEANTTFLLVTYGSSWRSRMLLGALTVTQGVPPDIDWSTWRPAAMVPDAMAARSRRTTPRPPR